MLHRRGWIGSRSAAARRRRRAVLAAAASTVAAAALLTGCDPDTGFFSIPQYHTVVMLRDQSFDFGVFETFALPDSVVNLRIPSHPVTNNTPYIYNGLILEKVRENFQAMGYTEVDPSIETPDFFVLVSVTIQPWEEFPYVREWWANWGWFGDWPGWSQLTNGDYPDNYLSNDFVFPEGTVFVDILDSRNPSADPRRIPVRWTAILNGILQGTDSGTFDRVRRDLDEAFDRSGYLGAGGGLGAGEVTE